MSIIQGHSGAVKLRNYKIKRKNRALFLAVSRICPTFAVTTGQSTIVDVATQKTGRSLTQAGGRSSPPLCCCNVPRRLAPPCSNSLCTHYENSKSYYTDAALGSGFRFLPPWGATDPAQRAANGIRRPGQCVGDAAYHRPPFAPACGEGILRPDLLSCARQEWPRR